MGEEGCREVAEQVPGSGCERGAKEELLSFSFLACPLPPSPQV